VYNHYNICNISICFCNIRIKHLQHTSKTSETFRMYACNMHQVPCSLRHRLHQDAQTLLLGPVAPIVVIGREHTHGGHGWLACGQGSDTTQVPCSLRHRLHQDAPTLLLGPVAPIVVIGREHTRCGHGWLACGQGSDTTRGAPRCPPSGSRARHNNHRVVARASGHRISRVTICLFNF
jgi:hypothetical protein